MRICLVHCDRKVAGLSNSIENTSKSRYTFSDMKCCSVATGLSTLMVELKSYLTCREHRARDIYDVELTY